MATFYFKATHLLIWNIVCISLQRVLEKDKIVPLAVLTTHKHWYDI